MLTIQIQNDGTGTETKANYRYQVLINQTVIESGEIKGHNRKDGWQRLTAMLVENSLFKGVEEFIEEFEESKGSQKLEYVASLYGTKYHIVLHHHKKSDIVETRCRHFLSEVNTRTYDSISKISGEYTPCRYCFKRRP